MDADRARERNVTEAKWWCRRCPVIEECLLHAVTWPEPFGTWGGLTASERGPIRSMWLLDLMSEEEVRAHAGVAPARAGTRSGSVRTLFDDAQISGVMREKLAKGKRELTSPRRDIER